MKMLVTAIVSFAMTFHSVAEDGKLHFDDSLDQVFFEHPYWLDGNGDKLKSDELFFLSSNKTLRIKDKHARAMIDVFDALTEREIIPQSWIFFKGDPRGEMLHTNVQFSIPFPDDWNSRSWTNSWTHFKNPTFETNRMIRGFSPRMLEYFLQGLKSTFTTLELAIRTGDLGNFPCGSSIFGGTDYFSIEEKDCETYDYEEECMIQATNRNVWATIAEMPTKVDVDGEIPSALGLYDNDAFVRDWRRPFIRESQKTQTHVTNIFKRMMIASTMTNKTLTVPVPDAAHVTGRLYRDQWGKAAAILAAADKSFYGHEWGFIPEIKETSIETTSLSVDGEASGEVIEVVKREDNSWWAKADISLTREHDNNELGVYTNETYRRIVYPENVEEGFHASAHHSSGSATGLAIGIQKASLFSLLERAVFTAELDPGEYDVVIHCRGKGEDAMTIINFTSTETGYIYSEEYPGSLPDYVPQDFKFNQGSYHAEVGGVGYVQPSAVETMLSEGDSMEDRGNRPIVIPAQSFRDMEYVKNVVLQWYIKTSKRHATYTPNDDGDLDESCTNITTRASDGMKTYIGSADNNCLDIVKRQIYEAEEYVKSKCSVYGSKALEARLRGELTEAKEAATEAVAKDFHKLAIEDWNQVFTRISVNSRGEIKLYDADGKEVTQKTDDGRPLTHTRKIGIEFSSSKGYSETECWKSIGFPYAIEWKWRVLPRAK